MSGTFHAAPLASALAALMIAQHPEWTETQMTGAIQWSSSGVYSNMLSYYPYFQMPSRSRIDAYLVLGDNHTPISGLLAPLSEQAPLAVGLGVAGACVLALILAWVIIAQVRRRRITARPQEAPVIEAAFVEAPLVTAQLRELSSDAPLPDAPLPDASLPDAPLPDAPLPDAPPVRWRYSAAQADQAARWRATTAQAGQPPRWKMPPPQPGQSPRWKTPAASISPNTDDALEPVEGVWGHLLVLRGPSVAAEHALSTDNVVIGRSDDATITLGGDLAISRQHVRLTFQNGRVQITDLNSSHGTLINGRPLTGTTKLRSGDVITLGQTRIRYEQV
ncbi:MAG: FHA domain-containing protein [Oscillochloris sp.]|nr:FHA domain-containing protein [Oscillochloris sp.]